MDKLLQIQFDKLEASKRAMLHELASWPADRLTRNPTQDAWSAAQVLDHISKVESGILQVVGENLSEPHVIARGDRVGSFIVRCVMRSRMRVSVPQEASAVVPAGSVSVNDALAAWAAARTAWSRMLERAPAAAVEQGVFQHPRGGWMNLPDTVIFLRLHHDHHRPQLQRIKRTLV